MSNSTTTKSAMSMLDILLQMSLRLRWELKKNDQKYEDGSEMNNFYL